MLGFGALATRAIAGPAPATGGAPRFAEAAQTVGVTQSAAASVRIVATAAQTVGVTQVATGFGLIVADAAQTIGVTQQFTTSIPYNPYGGHITDHVFATALITAHAIRRPAATLDATPVHTTANRSAKVIAAPIYIIAHRANKTADIRARAEAITRT